MATGVQSESGDLLLEQGLSSSCPDGTTLVDMGLSESPFLFLTAAPGEYFDSPIGFFRSKPAGAVVVAEGDDNDMGTGLKIRESSFPGDSSSGPSAGGRNNKKSKGKKGEKGSKNQHQRNGRMPMTDIQAQTNPPVKTYMILDDRFSSIHWLSNEMMTVNPSSTTLSITSGGGVGGCDGSCRSIHNKGQPAAEQQDETMMFRSNYKNNQRRSVRRDAAAYVCSCAVDRNNENNGHGHSSSSNIERGGDRKNGSSALLDDDEKRNINSVLMMMDDKNRMVKVCESKNKDDERILMSSVAASDGTGVDSNQSIFINGMDSDGNSHDHQQHQFQHPQPFSEALQTINGGSVAGESYLPFFSRYVEIRPTCAGDGSCIRSGSSETFYFVL
jgi:hypothetical protein